MEIWTRDQRRAAGLALRSAIPIAVHAEWPREPLGRRPLAILAGQNATRLQALVPVRNKRMSRSAFTFLRGAAAVMAADLRRTPATGLMVQACGDCHLMNFGAYVSPEGAAVFDINDFDETLRAPFEWDLKRLATSAVLDGAGKDDDDAGRTMARTAVAAYRDKMVALAEQTPMEIWRDRVDLHASLHELPDAPLRHKETSKLKALEQAAEHDFTATELGPDGRLRFADTAINEEGDNGKPGRGQRVFRLGPQDRLDAERAFAAYRGDLPEERRILVDRFRLQDIVFKGVGIGSMGTFCALALLTDADGARLVLQIKEAQPSVLLWPGQVGPYDNEGQRVVAGQRVMQTVTDIFLGATQDRTGRQFYVRRMKDSRIAAIGETVDRDAKPFYAALCGRTLARAHARSGDPAMIAGYIGKDDAFVDAIVDFAVAYAKLTRKDFKDFKTEIGSKPFPLPAKS